MGWLDSLKEKADGLINDAVDAAAEKVKATASDVIDASAYAAEKVKATASDVIDVSVYAAEKVKASASDIADAASTVVVDKIRELLSGIDFDGTIKTVRKVGKEQDIDVSKLIEFIKIVKQFVEDEDNEN